MKWGTRKLKYFYTWCSEWLNFINFFFFKKKKKEKEKKWWRKISPPSPPPPPLNIINGVLYTNNEAPRKHLILFDN